MRNLLAMRVMRRAWTGIRLTGSLLFPNEESRASGLSAQAIFGLANVPLRLAGFTPQCRSV
jgi:hypothetical protein